MQMTNKAKATRRNSIFSLMIAGLLGATAIAGVTGYPVTLQAANTQLSLNNAPAEGFADLVETVMPSVVSIQSKFTPAVAEGENNWRGNGEQFQFGFPPGSPFERFFRNSPNGEQAPAPGQRGSSVAQGSGFIISADGYAVTNNHVIKDATEVSVKFSDGREYNAKVIGSDSKTDLALLKIDGKDTFKPVQFAKGKPRVGDWVLAVGNPFGLGGTVTTGIISAAGRDIGAGPYDDFLQIDAPINRGNSGGPAFNLKGEVVGVNTAIYSPSGGSVGIGFAIPASTAENIIADLKDDGNVTRGWLGVQIQPVTEELAAGLGLSKPTGTLVAAVTDGSPAKAAGLRTGDTILKVNGKEIADPKGLSREVASIKPGTQVAFTVFRKGKETDIQVNIGVMPNEVAAVSDTPKGDSPTEEPQLGLALAPSADGDGVAVVDVLEGSPAAEHGIQKGDIILEVNGAHVDQPEAAEAAIRQSTRQAGADPILLLVKNRQGQRFIALKTAKG